MNCYVKHSKVMYYIMLTIVRGEFSISSADHLTQHLFKDTFLKSGQQVSVDFNSDIAIVTLIYFNQ